MKAGKSLVEMATELQRQSESKKDYIADTRKLSMEAFDTGKVVLQGVNGGMSLRPVAHQQLASTLQIPKAYYDRMLEQAPDLLARNVNNWLEKQPARKLVRTLDNEVRAILSDSYRPLDNFDLAQAVLPKLIGLEAEVMSTEITENRFYLKAVTPKIQGVVGKVRSHRAGDSIGMIDDIIQAGVVISNSEVGQGSLRVEALTYRLVCLNGAIHEKAIRKAHIGRGRSYDAIEDAREYFRDETRLADDRAFFLKVQDATAAMFDAVRFEQRISQYREASTVQIEKKVPEVMEVLQKKYTVREEEGENILAHLIRGGDMSKWGLGNAITRAAQDVPSYDRSYELESLGGSIIELSPTDWKVLAA